MPGAKVLPLLVFISVVIFSCQKKASETSSKIKLDWEALANTIVKQSDLQPGERVIMVAKPGDFDPLVAMLADKISKTGALYLGTVSVDSASWPDSWMTDFIRTAQAEPDYDERSLFNMIDLGIMLPGATPADAPYATLQGALRQEVGRTVHFHWSGAFDFSGRPVAMETVVHALYQKAILEIDYAKLSELQQQFENALRTDWVVITTPLGTNIKFDIGSRPVTKQNGDASNANTHSARNLIDREIELPAGAVRVAPLEETVEGVIAFPNALWSNQPVEGLVITFKNGQIADLKASLGQEAVETELQKGGVTAHSFREFALGFNPLLVKQETYIPHYGYGAGIVRLSLGNNQELGGNVNDGDYVRNTFFTDATVMIGQEVWVKDGKLMK